MKRRLLALALSLAMLIGLMPTAVSAATIAPLDDDKFTILWVSDPQWYSFAYPEIITAQNQWVADNYARMDMRYIVHTGDFVDNPHSHEQWAIMDKAYKIWDDAGLAYGILAGNHDVDGYDHTEFSQYFGKSRFDSKPWYGGDYDNHFGHYDLMTIEGVEFLFVYLGYAPSYTQEHIDWLNSVLAMYPNRIAMLSFHDYLTAAGVRSANGENIFQNVVLKNPNVRTVFCGHNYNAARRVETIDDNGDGKVDRTVYQMMANYQNTTNGGNGFMRFMEFDVADGTVTHRTYSPYTGNFGSDYEDGIAIDEYGTRDSFTLPFDFSAPAAKGSGDPAVGTVINNSDVIFSQTDTAQATVLPVNYQNIAAGDSFDGVGVYDRYFSLNAADAYQNPRALNYITATYQNGVGYTVTAVTKGANLSASDPFVAIPQNGIVIVMNPAAKNNVGVTVNVDTLSVGRTFTLRNVGGITTPSPFKTITMTTPVGVFSINGSNRITGNEQWVIYDNASVFNSYDHTWNMLFGFTPVSGQNGVFTLTATATELGVNKKVAMPQNGFVLAINTFWSQDPLRDELAKRFTVGTRITLNNYTVGQIPTYNAQSILPPDSTGWMGDSALVGTYQDGNAQVIYKKSGSWPEVDYDLPTPITFDPAETALVYDFFMETGCKDNILLMFKNSNSSSSTSSEYISIQSYFSDVVISSGSGDIKGDDLNHSGKIDLSTVTFPDGCYNDDGTLTLNTIRILSAGEVDKKLFLRQMTLTDELTDADDSVAQSISLFDASKLAVGSADKAGSYTYRNGKLTATADTDAGFEVAFNLNKAVNVKTLKNWLVNVSSDVRFDIKLEVTTAGEDASYGLVSDFYPALGVTLDNEMIPAGSYRKDFDLLSCYEWNQVVPANGMSTVKRVVITLGGKGTLSLHALQMSNTKNIGYFSDGAEASSNTTFNTDMFRVDVGTSVSELLASLSASGTLTVYDRSGAVVTSGNVATDMVVKLIVNGAVVDQAVISVNGDVNGSGTLDTMDAREVLMQVLGVNNLSAAQLAAADYDQDNTILSSDARSILMTVVNG